MQIVKKLIFAPFFLIFFIILIYQLNPLFKSYEFIFSLSVNTLINLIIISILISLSSFLFILFASFSPDWKLVVPVGILTSLTPFIFLGPSLAVVLGVGILVCLIITYLGLENSLKSYLNFNPNNILGPSIRHLAGLLIFIICIAYFLAINKVVSEKGFALPDSLIDAALKFTPQENQSQSSPQLSLPQDQIELLKKNPDLLKQSKQIVKDQVQSFIKPYLNFIPPALALLLFLTLQSITSLVNLLIYPLLWITFYVLEKTGFVKFVTETREVKKMVI